MDTTTSIFLIISVIIQIIVFLAVIFLVLSLIKIIKSLSARIENLQKDFDDFKVKLEPGIEDGIVLVKKLNKIADTVENNIHKFENVADKFKSFSEDVIEFGSKVKEKIEPPVLDTVTTFTAIFKGVKTFFERLKDHDKLKSVEENYLFENTESDFGKKQESIESSELKDDFEDINKELNEVRKKLEEMKKV
ncbi:MAG: hypothetical protein N2490_04410 [Ignavibacteria bacterium]|nr:hypothetical protein [Ignavibacteria bacterium]